MGLFGKKKIEKKELMEELPPLPPMEMMQQAKPSGLVSEVEHVTSKPEEIPVPKPVEIPKQEIPLAPKPVPQPAPKPKLKHVKHKPQLRLPELDIFEAKDFAIPEFSDRKIKELPDFPEAEDFLKEPETKELFEEKELPKPPIMPVFVEVDSFKSLLDDINKMKSTLAESKEGFASMETLRMEQDKSLNKWKSVLEDLQRKLIFIDRNLFEKRTL